ncbi:MAG: hypothetical protein F6K16_43250 [Symploca sp. SIO2B6]|nr:hypothetical protein [Symploca sp. SIO2B6]
MSSSVWLSAFLRDETTPNSDVASWVIVLIATLIWPLSVPLAIKERYGKKQKATQSPPTLEGIVEKQYI